MLIKCWCGMRESLNLDGLSSIHSPLSSFFNSKSSIHHHPTSNIFYPTSILFFQLWDIGLKNSSKQGDIWQNVRLRLFQGLSIVLIQLLRRGKQLMSGLSCLQCIATGRNIQLKHWGTTRGIITGAFQKIHRRFRNIKICRFRIVS